MIGDFNLTQFNKEFPDENSCLDEIKYYRYGYKVNCKFCKKHTIHYRIKNRLAYSCKSCRHQIHPLSGTIFEKSATPLKLWFYAIFLMTHTRGRIKITHLQRELGVTYKTAWRIHTIIYSLMKQNHEDLLAEPTEKVFKWTFLNKLELKVVHKQESSA